MNADSEFLRIILTRHGETEWNRIHRFQGRSDVPLNAIGRAQAEALAEALKDEPIGAFYSSPLSRAQETARIVMARHPSASLVVEEGFIEMDLGIFDGIYAGEWAEKNPEFLKQWRDDPASVTMPGGENLKTVQKRAVEALERVCKPHGPGETVLISAHNFVNLTILCAILDAPLSDFRTLKQGTTAVNVLHRNRGDRRDTSHNLNTGDTFVAEVINDCSHLDGFKPEDYLPV